MGQRQLGDGVDVARCDRRAAFVRGERGGGLVDREVGAEAVGPFAGATGAERGEDRVGDLDRGQETLGAGDPFPLAAVGLGPAGAEGRGIGLEREPAADDLGAERGVGHRLDLDGQAEAVEQLRAEVALLGVHRPDEDETRGMAERQALALDVVDAHRGGVKQQVHQVIAEEVHLVDVQDAPVRGREQARLERPRAGAQRPFQVQAADHAVFGRPDGKVDQSDGAFDRLQAIGQGPVVNLFARRAMEGVAGVDFDLGQERRERTHGRAFGRSLRTSNQDAAKSGMDRGQGQGALHPTLADDRREGIDSLPFRESSRGNVRHGRIRYRSIPWDHDENTRAIKKAAAAASPPIMAVWTALRTGRVPV